MAGKPGGRYAHIDAMRAVAVMLVVVGHAGLGHVVPGGSGVTIFFSISGFIITYLMLRERDSTGGFAIRSFYLRRVLKIGPPLLLWVIIPTLVLALFAPISWPVFVSILLFFFNWFKTVGIDAPLPGSGVVWSLSIEEQFYLGVAAIWLLAVKTAKPTRWLAIAASVAAVASLATRIVIAASSPIPFDRIYFGSDTRLDAIAVGVLTALAYHHARRQPGRIRTLVAACSKDVVLVAAVLLYLVSLLIRDEWFAVTFRFTAQSVAACLVILYGFGTEHTWVGKCFSTLVNIRVVQVIGLSSYSIYLMHLTVIDYSTPLVAHLPGLCQIPVFVLLGTLPGVLAYYAVEVPVHRLRNNWSAARRPRLTTGRRRDDAR